MENFILSSTPIEVSEYPNHKEVTFLISVLGEYNANDVLIEEEEGEKYHSTIVGYPILAYLTYDKKGKPNNFGGHELRAKYNSETKKIDHYFATFPIGSVTESWIEEREVEGYDGEKKCILIKTKLWKSRFPEYFKVFDKLWESGGISSSWEISSSETKKTTKGKILKAFEFIGNCLLGSSVQGAVKGAGVLEVASENESNYELSNALLIDIKNEEEDEGRVGNEDNKHTSSLSENDVYRKVRKAINNASAEKYYYLSMIYPYEFRAIAYDWNREKDSDFVEFAYSVNSDDTVSITSQKDVEMIFKPKSTVEGEVAELQTKLEEAQEQVIKASKLLEEATGEKEVLATQVAELTPFKEKVEQLVQAEQAKELAQQREKLKEELVMSNLFKKDEIETSEDIVSALESVDKKAIQIMIAERYIKSLEKPETVTSSAKPQFTPRTNINDDDLKPDHNKVMSSFLKSK